MRAGIRLGVDVGSVRVGVARSDQAGVLVLPLETVPRDRRGQDLRRIVALVREYEAIEVVIGLPLHLAGGEGESARMARSFGRALKRRLPKTRVCLVDERLSSNQAHGRLTEAGLSQAQQRMIVDQVAAQVILEQALASERATGLPPGEPIEKVSPDERNGSE
ncbi:Holliday junction resolvase RuvX [Scrofimicrobium appendicitidis]|uniref:Holliday junction resolvase RuvX n=1 Tax=Scrofimicrobium appendicitidis TaxID=3079930 RepID=UPI00399D76C3